MHTKRLETRIAAILGVGVLFFEQVYGFVLDLQWGFYILAGISH